MPPDADHRTRSWSSIVQHYRSRAAAEPRLAAMADLVERMASSRYAAGLHPVTSHDLLRLFATERFDFGDDQIQIEHDGVAFVVRYTASLGRPFASRPAASDWSTRAADGLAALERCLHHLRWVVEERPSESRAVE